MKAILLLCIFLLASTGVYATPKSFIIGDDRVISYEIQENWTTFKKKLPADLGVQSIKIVIDKDAEIQGLFMIIKDDNPTLLKAGSPDKFIEFLHNGICSGYVEKSTEGINTPKIIKPKDKSGLISTFTDKSMFLHDTFSKMNHSDVNYKYITLITMFIGDRESGAAASMALLSNELSGAVYEAAMATISSFEIQKNETPK